MFSFHFLSACVKHEIVDINIQDIACVKHEIVDINIQDIQDINIHGVYRGQLPHKNLSPLCSPLYDDFKTSTPSPPLCSSKLHKYNYEKAPYIGSSYHQFPQANLFTGLLTCSAFCKYITVHIYKNH